MNTTLKILRKNPTKLPTGNTLSFDTETTGLFPRKGDRFYCISWCNKEGSTAVLSFPVNRLTREVKYDDRLDLVRDFAQDSSIIKVAHNTQFDTRMIEVLGIEVKGPVVDTMNLIRLLKSSESLALKPFCEKYFEIPNDDERDLKEKTMEMRRIGRKKGWKIFEGKGGEEGQLAPDYWLAGPKYYEPYCIRDSERAMIIYKTLRPEIDQKGLAPLWKNEMKTWKVLRKVENRGITVDKEKVLSVKEQMKKSLDIFKKKAIRLAGNINFRSSPQLKKVLYEILKEPIKYHTQKHQPAVDFIALSHMKSPLAKHVLEMRACEKTIEFMDQYLNFIVKEKDGWILHPSFSQCIPTTGRESSSNPNMQQVSAGERDKGITVKTEARSVFIPRKNYVLRSYDWKNIEVYIPAFQSGDVGLLSVLKKGGDVHQETSEYLTNTIGKEISRYDAKRIFFGLQYGMGRRKLSRELGIEYEMAEEILFRFGEAHVELMKWMEGLKRQVFRRGFIKTPFGRHQEVSMELAYKIVNFFVQGTAADILKFSKVRLEKALRKYDAHIVLPIHDEMLLEIHKSENMAAIDSTVLKCMQTHPELNMDPYKIPVSISAIKDNWLNKTKIKVI